MSTVVTSPSLTLILARADNGVIGNQNQLPWHLPEELAYFKSTTMGHALIMGRKTFESIGRPLPGRHMVVVTRNRQWQHDGCTTATGLSDALAKASAPHPVVTHTDQVFVIGGATLYAQAIEMANRLLITQVAMAPPGDTFMDAPDRDEWECVSSEKRVSKNGTEFSLQDWRRRA